MIKLKLIFRMKIMHRIHVREDRGHEQIFSAIIKFPFR